MAKKMYVVYCEDYGTYWCGLNTWGNLLRQKNQERSRENAGTILHPGPSYTQDHPTPMNNPCFT